MLREQQEVLVQLVDKAHREVKVHKVHLLLEHKVLQDQQDLQDPPEPLVLMVPLVLQVQLDHKVLQE